MWVLIHKATGEKRYLLAEKQKYSVGRNQADIALMDDNSISRVHAFIHVSTDSVKIVDPGSKYGVYCNANDITLNKRMDLNEPLAMQVGDIVRFGRFENIWRLEKIDITCCTSTLHAGELPELLKSLNIVNGNLQQVWNEECTHLVMPSVTVTIKVLQSLAHGVPIVTPAFWNAYVECVRENRQQLPNVEDFIPVINEGFVRNNPALLHVDLRRQRLFQGKKFMFMTRRQMASFESIIQLAHGECDCLQGNKFAKKHLLRKEIVPMLNKTVKQSQATEDVHNIVAYLEKNGRRAINESELSLAILHCSTDRYCNPDFSMQNMFEVNSVDSTEGEVEALVHETPRDPAGESNDKPAPETIVPESLNLTDEDAVSNRNIDSSAVYSERIGGGESEMAEPINQFAQPTTSVMNLGKRCRRRLSSDDAPDIESSVQKKSKTNDVVPEERGCTSTTESSQVSSLSGFLVTQNRFSKSNATVPAPSLRQSSEQPQISPAERRKRALEALQSLSDDEGNNNDTDDNPFTFATKRGRKRAKLNPATNDDEDVECVYNFGSRQIQRNRRALSQQASSTTVANDSSAGESNVLMPFNRPATNTIDEMPYIKRVETSTDGWLSRAFKSDVSIGQEPVKPTALPTGVRIKEEKLEEWEMTDEEKKQKWLKSLENAIEVKTFNVTFTRRIVADETDGNLSAHNASIRNFKTFVKKRNYIAQKTIVRTNPMNITVNPFARI